MNFIPFYASAGITGFESPAADYLQLPLSLDELLVEHPNATYIGLAQGRSMEGVGIYDGDVLIVDRHVEVQDKDVVVANLNGEFVCKLIDTKQRRLLSASPGHMPVCVSYHDQFTLEGVVTRSIRCHRRSRIFAEG